MPAPLTLAEREWITVSAPNDRAEYCAQANQGSGERSRVGRDFATTLLAVDSALIVNVPGLGYKFAA
jgi:hypothetical protein